MILSIISWLIINKGYQGQLQFFLIGLFFALAGDVILMLPNDYFLAGLICFLFTHIAYMRGFLITIPEHSVTWLILAILVGVILFAIFDQMSNDYKTQDLGSLRIPVFIYSIVISGMVGAALLTLTSPNSKLITFPAILVALGAMIFLSSDEILAWNKFINPIKYASLFVIMTYHIGQFAITIGAGLNFLT